MKTTQRSSFGVADHGVSWAMSQFPKSVSVSMAPFSKARGKDDYAIRSAKNQVIVEANSAVGAIAGLLEAAEALSDGQSCRSGARGLQFRTRNYKHEIQFEASNPRSILYYTDETWEALCRQVVAHQFNGLVFYSDYHFFQYVLDYKEWPGAVSSSFEERAAARAALQRGLAMARKYGLTTFIQHYVGHFTPELATSLKIPTTGRYSAVDHPDVLRYCRYCYREVFKQLPDLDGLYFNFESYNNAWKHLLATAIPEMNRMKRKPIAVFRVWGFNEIEGMRRIMKAYKGRIILSHKISDTNDTYYLPVADSRAIEWKKALGQGIEWMYCLGPCHNCATNLTAHLWADYTFVQTILKDACKKRADSISFHAVQEFFAPGAPHAEQIFSARELDLARFNSLHMRAAVDFVNNRVMTTQERACYLAGRVGVPAKAGKPLVDAIHASSQLVLLAYQQFCMGSDYDGFLHRGRYSHIQEPFFYYPCTWMNKQASSPMWQIGPMVSWIQKRIDTRVTPDNWTQPILDYVDPSKPKAAFTPLELARQLSMNIARANRSFDAYRREAGDAAADALAPYLRRNLMFGEYVAREIRAAIQLYSIYFAKSRPAIITALRKGLEELNGLAVLAADRSGADFKSVARASLLSRLNPDPEIGEAQDMLRLAQTQDFPMPAYRAWLDSRRMYNEIRRVVRPNRKHVPATRRHIDVCLAAAVERAEACLRLLNRPALAGYVVHVQAWLDFLHDEQKHTQPPSITCPGKPSDNWQDLHHDHCFRAGENFLDDLSGFFKNFDYLRPARHSFKVWHTGRAVAVTLREEGVDMAQRKAMWAKYGASGDTSFVSRIFFDVENKGRRSVMFIVWPLGEMVSQGDKPSVPVSTEFSCTDTAWQVTAHFPYKLLGRVPRKGEVWGLNVTANPAVASVQARIWASQYDFEAGDPLLFGKMRFE